METGGDDDRQGDRPPVLTPFGGRRQLVRRPVGRLPPGSHTPPCAGPVRPVSSPPGDAAPVPASQDLLVLHLRLNLIAAGPPVLDDCVKYIEGELRPAVESQPGSLGLSLLISPGLGVAVLESFWASAHALQASEQAAASLRARTGAASPGIGDRRAVPDPGLRARGAAAGGEAVRLTRMQAKPSAVEDVAEAFGDSAVPWLAETPGFRRGAAARRPGLGAPDQPERVAGPAGAGGQPEHGRGDPGRRPGTHRTA